MRHDTEDLVERTVLGISPRVCLERRRDLAALEVGPVTREARSLPVKERSPEIDHCGRDGVGVWHRILGEHPMRDNERSDGNAPEDGRPRHRGGRVAAMSRSSDAPPVPNAAKLRQAPSRANSNSNP